MFCSQCGIENADDAKFCRSCGASLNLSNPTTTTSTAEIPDGVKGWSWGAFLLNWIWAIGNKTWIGLIALIPYVGFIMAIVLGFKGREWAWKNNKWDSVEHFNRVQKKWSYWGVVIMLVIVFLSGLVAAIAIPAYRDYQRKAQEAVNSAQVATPTESTTTSTSASVDCEKEGNALWYEYEPAVVSLRGKLISAKGETPDEKPITYPAIQLESPVSLQGRGEFNSPESGVTLMQLVLNEQFWPIYEKEKGADVVVTGTMYHRDNGNQQTNVLITPTQIVPAKPLCISK